MSRYAKKGDSTVSFGVGNRHTLGMGVYLLGGAARTGMSTETMAYFHFI